MRWRLYLLFLFSGATALVYQSVWVRQQSLVFGGTHLAVATVLAVFMAGLALGGWAIGRRADRWTRPLLAYGRLELGVAASALLAYGAIGFYPELYAAAARPVSGSPAALTTIRFLFAAAAMLLPTTLMGATLPVLARSARGADPSLATHLSRLYGINTLGAVIGAISAGFFLLPRFGVARTLLGTVLVNVALGLAAVLLGRQSPAESATVAAAPTTANEPADADAADTRLALVGTAVSGCCALGYEVLWTRTLGTTLGTSTYAFTVMLAAFLSGIGLGGASLGAFLRGRGARLSTTGLLGLFAAIQALIGVAALGVTWLLGDLVGHSVWLHAALLEAGLAEFAARQATTFAAAFLQMLVPAVLMGAAFPLAGVIHARRGGRISGAVGEVLAWNTVGAIAGALLSGFVLVRLVGIERSLIWLAALNLALASFVLTAARRGVWRRRAGAAVALALLVVPPLVPPTVRLWNAGLLAVYRNNQRTAFDTRAEVEAALANTDVLYFHEGDNSTVSVIRIKGGEQSFVVNGKVEASTLGEDVQCQYLLGHLPVLMHPEPRSVFVLGLGTGMTLGAVTLHPELERIVLAEMEPAVVEVARTFRTWNHDALADPRLEIAFCDGRNWLLTTRERFDVITADPIHPWTRGSAYLYTADYYRLAAARLRPGGVMMQWLPLYELTPRDVASVVRTFRTAFPHTQVWLTHYDAHLVGSDRPLSFDPSRLAARLAHGPVQSALARVDMGTPADFLDFFMMGDDGSRAFGELGVVNTDDNLYLEFSAPRSTGVVTRVAENLEAMARYRDPNPGLGASATGRTAESTSAHLDAVGIYDRLHALYYRGRAGDPEFAFLAEQLRRANPAFAPLRQLQRSVARELSGLPRPLAATRLAVDEPGQGRTVIEITAVTHRTGEGRAVLLLVDNAARVIYGEAYLAADESLLDARLQETALAVLRALEAATADLVAGSPSGRPGGDALRARLRATAAAELARLPAP